MIVFLIQLLHYWKFVNKFICINTFLMSTCQKNIVMPINL